MEVFLIRKKVCYALAAAFVALGVVFGIRNFMIGEYGRGILGFASFAFLFLIPIFRRLLGEVPWFLLCEVYAFCILSYDIGSVYNFFAGSQYLDKVAHFLSGILFTTVGCCLYLVLRKNQPVEKTAWMLASYALFFSCTVAVVWEIYEFCGYVWFGLDSQQHETTGVFDTMFDLINCFVGSLLCCFSLWLWKQKDKKLLVGRAMEEFDQILRA